MSLHGSFLVAGACLAFTLCAFLADTPRMRTWCVCMAVGSGVGGVTGGVISYLWLGAS